MSASSATLVAVNPPILRAFPIVPTTSYAAARNAASKAIKALKRPHPGEDAHNYSKFLKISSTLTTRTKITNPGKVVVSSTAPGFGILKLFDKNFIAASKAINLIIQTGAANSDISHTQVT